MKEPRQGKALYRCRLCHVAFSRESIHWQTLTKRLADLEEPIMLVTPLPMLIIHECHGEDYNFGIADLMGIAPDRRGGV